MSFDGSSKTLVVGAGPSGIAAVGALIARSVPVHWVDPSFEVGALQRYCDVPANTKLSILVDQLKNFIPQATAMLCKGGAAAAAFERMITTAQHIPASEFDSCQLGWVRLGAVAEVMAAFTAELRTHPLVTSERGVVASLCPTAGGGYVATVERPRWGEIGSEIEGDIGSEIEREIDNEIGGEIGGEIISAVEIRVDSEDVGGVRRGEGVDSGMRGGGGGGKMGVVANSARSLGSPPLQPQLSSSSCDDVPCGSSPASRGRYHAAVLAVGGKPVEMPRQMLETGDELGAEGHGRSPVVIPLEEALQLDKLSELVEPDDVVGVVGGGHSGLVVASNLLEVLGVACVRLFVRRPVQLAHWDESKSEYGAWGFRGLKGLAASFAIDYGLVGREPSACVDDECDDELQLLDVALLATPGAQARAALGKVDKLVYCVGYECVPLDMLESSVELTGRSRSGQLTGVFGDGEPLQHLYGTGVGFADVEFSSGMPYPEVSFKRFTQRARCISEEIARSVAQIAC